VVALLLVVAGCGGSHSSKATTNGTISISTSTSTSTSTSPPTNAKPKHFDAAVSTGLTSAASVPKGPPHASGRAVIELSTKSRQACWSISVSGVQKLLSAHVRKAPPGKVGPVVLPLGATFAKTGCVFAPLQSIRAVIRNPRAYYVDVLARNYLNGALRGQLHAGR
jgi:CHRD domain